MGRSFTSTARRKQIVEAAIDVIADHGYDRATFTRITAHAGLSSPRMISYHFAGKAELIRQIVADVYRDAAGFIEAAVADATDPSDRLRSYIRANLEFVRDHPRWIAAITRIGDRLTHDDGEPYTSADVQEPGLRGIEPILRAGQADGRFRDFDVRAMALLIRGAIDIAAQRISGGHDIDVDGYAAELVTSVDRATRREPGDRKPRP